MKPDELKSALAKGQVGPLYWFYGDEPFLMEKTAKRIVELVVDPSFRDFNLDLFYGNEAQGQQIAAAAQTLPVFAERRMVLVKKADGLSAASLEALAEYVANPSPSTCLLLIGEKVDQRKKFFVEFKKKGELVEFKRPYENQLGPFIREEAALHGKKIAPAAAELLVYLIGNNLQDLSSQIEKVAVYAGKSETIGIDAVKEIVSDIKADSVFDLANALGEKNVGKALRNLHTLLRDGQAPLQILFMITRHFRQLWQVKELTAKKVSQQELAKLSGINPYFLRGFQEQVRNFTVSEFKDLFERFFETDYLLKSAKVKPSLIIERLVIDICSTQDRKRAASS